MERKDVGMLLIGLGLLCVGYTVGAFVNKPAPIPDGIYLNGRTLDLRRMSLEDIRKVLPDLRLPLPAQPDRKKKDGALGEVGEVAAVPLLQLRRPDVPLPKPVIAQFEQRGGQPKPVEAFGIETLVQVLRELKEAVFGNPKSGTPGLRDDIAKGLGDFYSTLRTGCIVAGGTLLALVGWIALSLHRIAEKIGKAV